jgi:hypothetical protein
LHLSAFVSFQRGQRLFRSQLHTPQAFTGRVIVNIIDRKPVGASSQPDLAEMVK